MYIWGCVALLFNVHPTIQRKLRTKASWSLSIIYMLHLNPEPWTDLAEVIFSFPIIPFLKRIKWHSWISNHTKEIWVRAIHHICRGRRGHCPWSKHFAPHDGCWWSYGTKLLHMTKSFVMWSNFVKWQIVPNSQCMPPCPDLRCFDGKSILSQSRHFCVEQTLTQKSCLWSKNYKFHVWSGWAKVVKIPPEQHEGNYQPKKLPIAKCCSINLVFFFCWLIYASILSLQTPPVQCFAGYYDIKNMVMYGM